MAIVINGSGTVTGISVGGLPDGIVDSGTLATNSVDSAELIDGAVDDSHMAAMAASKLTGALPAISGASLTGISAGKVLQVVHGAYSSEMSTTSGTTWVATGAEIAITPTSSSSKILVMFNQHIRVDKANNDQGAGFAIRRGTTTVWSTPQPYAFYSYNGTDSVQNDKRLYQPLTYLDSPNTTSSTTYSTRIIEYGSGTTYAQSDSTPTMMTLMEIAG